MRGRSTVEKHRSRCGAALLSRRRCEAASAALPRDTRRRPKVLHPNHVGGQRRLSLRRHRGWRWGWGVAQRLGSHEVVLLLRPARGDGGRRVVGQGGLFSVCCVGRSGPRGLVRRGLRVRRVGGGGQCLQSDPRWDDRGPGLLALAVAAADEGRAAPPY